MVDLELIQECRRAETPLQVLRLFSEHRDYVGSDPYYRDLNQALWEALHRVLDSEQYKKYGK